MKMIIVDGGIKNSLQRKHLKLLKRLKQAAGRSSQRVHCMDKVRHIIIIIIIMIPLSQPIVHGRRRRFQSTVIPFFHESINSFKRTVYRDTIFSSGIRDDHMTNAEEKNSYKNKTMKSWWWSKVRRSSQVQKENEWMGWDDNGMRKRCYCCCCNTSAVIYHASMQWILCVCCCFCLFFLLPMMMPFLRKKNLLCDRLCT